MRVATPGRIARPALARMISDALDAGSALLVAGAGYGKTMALEEAITQRPRRTVWLSCRDAGGEAGRLLMGTVEGLRATVPGLTDVVGERLAASQRAGRRPDRGGRACSPRSSGCSWSR